VGEGEGATGGDADIDFIRIACSTREIDDVFFNRIAQVDLIDCILNFTDLVGVDYGLEAFEHGVGGAEFQEFLFALFVWVPE